MYLDSVGPDLCGILWGGLWPVVIVFQKIMLADAADVTALENHYKVKYTGSNAFETLRRESQAPQTAS